MPSTRGSSNPRIKPASLTSAALAAGFFTTSATLRLIKLSELCCEDLKGGLMSSDMLGV